MTNTMTVNGVQIAFVDEGLEPGPVIVPLTGWAHDHRAFDRLGIHHRNELFALVAGDLHLSMLPPALANAQIKAGKLRALAVTSPQRTAQLPGVPTVAEQGFAGFEMTQWYGLLAPRKWAPAHLAKLEAEAVKIPASGPAPEGVGRNVRLTQIGAAKNRFKETIMRYQEVEKAYRTKYRQRTERQLRIVKPDATQAELQSALEGEASGQQIFSQALMNSNRQGEARGALREVQERHTDIQRIERTITELAALFQEMSILVEQQDEQLNVIKDHAQHTEHEVQAGRQQTDKAVVAARRARKRRWICFWLVVIIIAIIIAAVVGGVCGHGDTCSSNKN